jgi:hypothetical protein
MKLPIVQGWLFDFRAARKAVESGRNARIDHIADGCEVGKIRICHLEKSFFRDNSRLNEIFLGDDKCVCDISEAIVANCRLVIPTPTDQYRCAQSRIPIEMMRHG